MINLESITYIPILHLKPAEMAGIQELPNIDKDQISPLFVLRRWVGSRSFNNTIERVKLAFSNRPCFVDLDYDNLQELENKEENGNHVECLAKMRNLFDSSNGYENWFTFICENEYFLPTLLLEDLNALEGQLDRFIAIKRKFLIRLKMYKLNKDEFNAIIKTLLSSKYIGEEYVLLLDYGDINRLNYIDAERYISLFKQLKKLLSKAYLSFSGTSFPYNFTGSSKGEIPIYERLIYNIIRKEMGEGSFIYSDRASTRTFSQTAAGTPPPRIDYALKNDWRYIRKESRSGEKKDLYAEAAIEIMASEYWDPNLRLWATQMIEKTAMYDDYGIGNPLKATAVRVNLHLYQQLHYFTDLSDLTTDEEWFD